MVHQQLESTSDQNMDIRGNSSTDLFSSCFHSTHEFLAPPQVMMMMMHSLDINLILCAARNDSRNGS